MTNEIIIALIGLGTTIASGWVSHLFTRKKYRSEVDSTIIENMKESLEFYTKLSDDNKMRLETALKRNEILDTELRELRKQVNELMMSICYDLTCSARERISKRETISLSNTKNLKKSTKK